MRRLAGRAARSRPAVRKVEYIAHGIVDGSVVADKFSAVPEQRQL